jgi:hypothetical protein
MKMSKEICPLVLQNEDSFSLLSLPQLSGVVYAFRNSVVLQYQAEKRSWS